MIRAVVKGGEGRRKKRRESRGIDEDGETCFLGELRKDFYFLFLFFVDHVHHPYSKII